MNLDTTNLVTLAAMAAGTVNSLDLPNTDFVGAVFGVNLTTVTTASVVVTIYGKDIASGAYYPILASQAITAAGVTVLSIYPGLIGTATQISAVLPRTYRVTVVVTNNGGTAAVTGTVGASLIG